MLFQGYILSVRDFIEGNGQLINYKNVIFIFYFERLGRENFKKNEVFFLNYRDEKG